MRLQSTKDQQVKDKPAKSKQNEQLPVLPDQLVHPAHHERPTVFIEFKFRNFSDFAKAGELAGSLTM